jgi:hypothetical protein
LRRPLRLGQQRRITRQRDPYRHARQGVDLAQDKVDEAGAGIALVLGAERGQTLDERTRQRSA